MPTSIFENSEETWMVDLKQRSPHDLIDIDFEFALHNQNTNAIRACVGRLQKHNLNKQDIERVHTLLKHASNFTAVGWINVLRIFHLYDKKLKLGHHWVKNTPTVVNILQESLKSVQPQHHTKTQALVVRYALRTPYIEEISQMFSSFERQKIVEYILNPLSSEWKTYSGTDAPWDAQTANMVSATFPEYAYAVFYRIAASAFAFHTVNQSYNDQNITRSSFYQELNTQGNEGISANNLSLLALDSSMSFHHRKNQMIKDLETIYVACPHKEQRKYIKNLTESKYADVLNMSDILQSAAQKMVLESQLVEFVFATQEDRAHKI